MHLRQYILFLLITIIGILGNSKKITKKREEIMYIQIWKKRIHLDQKVVFILILNHQLPPDHYYYYLVDSQSTHLLDIPGVR